MKYYIDTEFVEGTQKESFPINIFRKETKPTIDLISIALVSEDGREYYAISKDFNLKEAWNRYDEKECYGASTCQHKDFQGNCIRKEKCDTEKVYWLRENVLKPIFDEWNKYSYHAFNYKNFKYCIRCIGKTNKQIADEIKEFVYQDHFNRVTADEHKVLCYKNEKPIEFIGYYSDYDWVALCQLFGTMNQLPNGFPMYCQDLKQYKEYLLQLGKYKAMHKYPPSTKHNALIDARWNKELHQFLNNI